MKKYSVLLKNHVTEKVITITALNYAELAWYLDEYVEKSRVKYFSTEILFFN